MYTKNTLGRFRHFGRSTTFNPFSNSGDLKLLTDQWFYIPNQVAFAGTNAISIYTGLVSNASSFLSANFSAEIVDENGTTLTYLNPKLGSVGNNMYPGELDIVWFDLEGAQGDYWVNEKWARKILKLSGKFECSAITANEMNQLTGCIIPFSGSVAKIPDRALPCQGQTISRFYYANLFEIIGTTFGVGDGINTFHLPDLRDATIKGVNSTTDKDLASSATSILNDPDKTKRVNRTNGVVGAVLGSYQKWAIQNIAGVTSTKATPYNTPTGPFSTSAITTPGHGAGTSGSFVDITFDASRTVNAGASTRDNNLYLHYIIFI